MSTVEGLLSLTKKLEAMKRQARAGTKGGKVVVKVGYTQNYGIWVHEDLTANHPNGGQAKFLEVPFREMIPRVPALLAKFQKEGKTLAEALLLVGLELQAESQKLVPVDTGALRASAFTRLE